MDTIWRIALLALVFVADLVVFIRLFLEELREHRARRVVSARRGSSQADASTAHYAHHASLVGKRKDLSRPIDR